MTYISFIFFPFQERRWRPVLAPPTQRKKEFFYSPDPYILVGDYYSPGVTIIIKINDVLSATIVVGNEQHWEYVVFNFLSSFTILYYYL